jgi:hypothetical protein
MPLILKSTHKIHANTHHKSVMTSSNKYTAEKAKGTLSKNNGASKIVPKEVTFKLRHENEKEASNICCSRPR